MNHINKTINVTKSSMPSFEEYCNEIKVLWENRWLSNRGIIHKQFEEKLKEKLGVQYLSLFANGHVALEVAIDAFDFSEGSEVITTPYTHCSTTHCIVRNGLFPVFCDINEKDLTIDVEQIENYITDKTVAIIPTHVYGCACNVYEIDRIAQKHNLKVLYDAAHAFGITINGHGIANFGDASMFSCHATKIFHTIEGGITVFKDVNIYNKLESLINFGYSGPEEVIYISTNARMNEFEAAMGLCNLRYIDTEILKRKMVADKYTERLSGIKGIEFISPQKNVTQNYSYYIVFFNGYKKSRNEIQEALAKNNIFARKYFYPITTELKCYVDKYRCTVKNTPIAKKASETVLSLPIFSELSIEDVEKICKIII